MPESPLRLIKAVTQLVPQSEVNHLPKGIRGIYALFAGVADKPLYNVVYVGMSTTSVRGRLKRHRRTKEKLWSHCSVFEVWDNVRDSEIAELEGLLRHIYRYDEVANQLNEMKSFKALKKVGKITLDQRKPQP